MSKRFSIRDGLVNLLTGMGTSSTKRHHNRFVYTHFISHGELDAAYRESWLARQIVDIPAEDALREGRTFVCEDAEEISREEERLNVMAHVQEAYSWDRLYGGAIILMLTNQNLEEPLNVDAIRQGDLRRLLVFERNELSAPVINNTNPLAINYLEPEFYMIQGGAQRIHFSHVIRFDGVKLPRRIRISQDGWGDSELRKVMEDLSDIISAKSGVAELIQESNVDTITREGLSDELATGEEAELSKRYTSFRQMKSVFKLALLDGNEQFDRKSISFSGIADVLSEFRTWISGAADIPVTRLFGQSVTGLNNTGEGDLNNYYDSVKAKQTRVLTPKFRMLDEVMVRSALGNFPEDCEFEWNPLIQQSGQEIAAEALTNAQTDRIYLDDNIVNEVHVARRLQQAGMYSITDEDISDIEQRMREQELNEEDLLDDFDNPRGGGQQGNPGESGGSASAREEEN